jgi:hypothetical protein
MAKKEGEEEAFYVGIKDPIGMRRSILESSKDIVQYLQRAERFKAVRAEKTEQILKLKELSKDIGKLIRKIRSSLPKTKMRISLYEREQRIKREEAAENKKKAAKKKAKEGSKKKAEVPQKKEIIPPEEKKQGLSELEKLESELGEIESRLGRMS